MSKKEPSHNTSYSSMMGDTFKTFVKGGSKEASPQPGKQSPLTGGIVNMFRHKVQLSVAQTIQ